LPSSVLWSYLKMVIGVHLCCIALVLPVINHKAGTNSGILTPKSLLQSLCFASFDSSCLTDGNHPFEGQSPSKITSLIKSTCYLTGYHLQILAISLISKMYLLLKLLISTQWILHHSCNILHHSCAAYICALACHQCILH
jgi:hypothetical protein